MTQDIVYVDGEFVDYEQARIEIEDRGYQFADGVYEVVVTYDGQPFKMDEHFRRLEQSASALEIDFEDYRGLQEDARRLLDKNHYQQAKLYIQLTRGVSRRSHSYPDDMEPRVVMTVREYNRNPADYYRNGVKVITVPDERWPRCYIKTIALLPNILAKKQAKRAGAYEAIQVRDGFITEGTSSNLFIVRGNRVITPPATNYILNGITRQVVLDGLQVLGIPGAETSISKKELREADEVFLSGTTSEIMPVVDIDGQAIGDGKPGPVTKKVQDYYFELIGVRE